MEPAESLHDITQIPFFPYAPGLIVWGSLILISLALYFLLRTLPRLKAPRPRINPFELALGDINALLKEASSSAGLQKAHLFRASLTVRRLLGALVSSGTGIAEMDLDELHAFRENASEMSLRALLDSVILLESYKYRPDQEVQTLAPEALAALVHGLRSFESTYREKQQDSSAKDV